MSKVGSVFFCDFASPHDARRLLELVHGDAADVDGDVDQHLGQVQLVHRGLDQVTGKLGYHHGKQSI